MQDKQRFQQLRAPLLICRLTSHCLHASNATDSTWTQVGVQLIDHQAVEWHGLPRSVLCRMQLPITYPMTTDQDIQAASAKIQSLYQGLLQFGCNTDQPGDETTTATAADHNCAAA